jgi:hypothetical protein
VSTPDPAAGDAVAAVLMELAEIREQVTGLRLAQADYQTRITDLTVALHRIAGQRRSGKDGEQEGGYEPIPAPRWWQLAGEERAEAIGRLRAWVATVFRPGYGHLARQVSPCWEQHDLCLYLLAWLSELHAVIFLAPERLLTSEADWHTRLLPAAAAQMAAETGGCDHLAPVGGITRVGADPWAGSS